LEQSLHFKNLSDSAAGMRALKVNKSARRGCATVRRLLQNENILKSDRNQICVKYLSPNVIVLIQTMDKGVIATMNS
jgi:hypothetical protein